MLHSAVQARAYFNCVHSFTDSQSLIGKSEVPVLVGGPSQLLTGLCPTRISSYKAGHGGAAAAHQGSQGSPLHEELPQFTVR